MKRQQQILAAVLVLQIALAVFVFWPKPSATTEEALIFPDMAMEDIVALTVADEQGASVSMRKAEDDAWVLPDADDYPVRLESVATLLDKVVILDTSRLVARTEASHKQLRVSADDFVRRLDLETVDGTAYTLYLGSAPNYASAHFRLDGHDETYLTSSLSEWEINATASSWVESAYLNIPQEALTQVVLENSNGTFTFMRTKDNAWTLKELPSTETLSASKVSTLVSRVAGLSLMRPLGESDDPAYGLDDPAAVVTLKTADETVTLTVGAQEEAGAAYVVKASNSPYYVTAAEFNVQPLVEDTLADFLEAEPTPEPAVQP